MYLILGGRGSEEKEKLKARDLVQKVYAIAKQFLPTICLVLYSFIGAGFLYIVDGAGPSLSDNYGPNNVNGCIASVGFYGALYYATTLYTSIGYGNVYPCNVGSKLITIVYSLLGLPVVFSALDSIGRLFFNVLSRLYKIYQSTHCDNATIVIAPHHSEELTLSENTSIGEHDNLHLHMPVSLGVTVTCLWLLMCAWFFTLTEGWPYGDSVYFVMITVLTVGLGDFAPVHYRSALINFIAVLIGLALVSMSIKILQDNIEGMLAQMQKEMFEEYKRRLVDGDEAGAPAATGNQYGFLRTLMSDKQMKELESMQEKQAQMVVAGVQAVVSMEDRAVNASCQTTVASVQCDIRKLDTKPPPPPPPPPKIEVKSVGVQAIIVLPEPVPVVTQPVVQPTGRPPWKSSKRVDYGF